MNDRNNCEGSGLDNMLHILCYISPVVNQLQTSSKEQWKALGFA